MFSVNLLLFYLLILTYAFSIQPNTYKLLSGRPKYLYIILDFNNAYLFDNLNKYFIKK